MRKNTIDFAFVISLLYGIATVGLTTGGEYMARGEANFTWQGFGLAVMVATGNFLANRFFLLQRPPTPNRPSPLPYNEDDPDRERRENRDPNDF